MTSHLVAACVGAVLASLVVWVGQEWRHDAAISTMAATHAQVMQGYADEAATAAQALLDRQAEHQKALAAIDARLTEELTNGNEEIDRLRAVVATGDGRLRVNAECPAPATGLPAATAAASVDDAAGPQLTGVAERNYFALREQIVRADAMIKGLQDYVQDVCLAR